MRSSGNGVAALIAISMVLPTLSQPASARSRVVTKGPVVSDEVKHDRGPVLRELPPSLAESGTRAERAIENPPNPNRNWKTEYRPDPVLQAPGNFPAQATPGALLEFDGLGYGDAFFCDCEPPDNDGAAGTTQYAQFLNTFYAVYDKSGNLLLGPLNGNSFWSGFGGAC